MVSTKGAALVTGASQGIGRAIALRLAKDAYAVAAVDLPSKAEALATLVAEISAGEGRATGITGDASSEEDVKTMITATVAELGDLMVVGYFSG
jgi:NAD(P)-dependent dehydrogenase (short-subunit alcohol dehydrogenase family)